jgi:UDP-glucuronate 4-epimerase
MKILLTGCAGFIGMHAALRLLARGDEVVGVDNLTPYYDVQLKRDRLAQLTGHANFRFIEADLADLAAVRGALGDWKPQRVLHLAAQPGVRYSIDNPALLPRPTWSPSSRARRLPPRGVEHLAYASSSSVYGGNRPAAVQRRTRSTIRSASTPRPRRPTS